MFRITKMRDHGMLTDAEYLGQYHFSLFGGVEKTFPLTFKVEEHCG